MHLGDSLSNPNKQLRRLFAALETAGGLPALLAKTAGPDEVTAVAQSRATDVEVVRVEVKENRILSPEQVAQLVEAYERGETVVELAKQFGIHRETVRRRLKQAGVIKRPIVKMTAELLKRATELYEQGWSTHKIGQEFGLNQTTVYKALKRAGVRMRKPLL